MSLTGRLGIGPGCPPCRSVLPQIAPALGELLAQDTHTHVPRLSFYELEGGGAQNDVQLATFGETEA